MDNEYANWTKDKSHDNLKSLIDASKSNINKAVQMYVGHDDPAARSHAKLLAVKAFKSYDPKKGTQLRTHFLNQLQPLRRFAARRRMVFSVPEGVQQDMAGLNTAKKELFDKLDRDPTDIELADFTGISVPRIRKLRKRKFDSAEGGLVNEEGEIFQAVTQEPNSLDTWSEFVYHDMNPTDRKIYEWRTGYNGRKMLSNNEIAKKLRLSPGAVSQRVAKIYDRIAEGAPGASSK